MKKMFKKLMMLVICAFCLITSTGCFSSRMKINYTISTSENGEKITSDIVVYSTVEEKYRESSSTPCYLKVKRGYSEIKTAEQNKLCLNQDSDCYVKEGKKYVKLVEKNKIKNCNTDDTMNCYIKENGEYVETKDSEKLLQCATEQINCYVKNGGSFVKMKVKNAIEIQECVFGNKKCYQYVEFTSYKLTNDNYVYKCYNEFGDYFETATYNRPEKIDLAEKKLVIDSESDMNNYVNKNLAQIPSEEVHSLVYKFDITNKESKTIYIEALEFGEITNNLVKKKSANKIQIITDAKKMLIDNKVYYVVEASKTITIKIQIKNLKTSDMYNKKNKELNLNINFNLK